MVFNYWVGLSPSSSQTIANQEDKLSTSSCESEASNKDSLQQLIDRIQALEIELSQTIQNNKNLENIICQIKEDFYQKIEKLENQTSIFQRIFKDLGWLAEQTSNKEDNEEEIDLSDSECSELSDPSLLNPVETKDYSIVSIKELEFLDQLKDLSTSICIGSDNSIKEQANNCIGKEINDFFYFSKEFNEEKKEVELSAKHRQIIETALKYDGFVLSRLKEKISWIIDKLENLKIKIEEDEKNKEEISSCSREDLTNKMTHSISMMTKSLIYNKGDKLTKEDIEEFIAYFELFEKEIQKEKEQKKIDEKIEQLSIEKIEKPVILKIEREENKALEKFKEKLLTDLHFCKETNMQTVLNQISFVTTQRIISAFNQENSKIDKKEFQNFDDFKYQHSMLIESIKNMKDGSLIYSDRLFECTKRILALLEQEINFSIYT